jgi:hypothetical protein
MVGGDVVFQNQDVTEIFDEDRSSPRRNGVAAGMDGCCHHRQTGVFVVSTSPLSTIVSRLDIRGLASEAA